MRIFTHTCPNCGTIVAANVLEDRRVMKCVREGCDEILRFTDLPEADREFFHKNRDQYQM
jgi:uncharacterized radical SAM superfamily Fe-S cluster-containing enzyme